MRMFFHISPTQLEQMIQQGMVIPKSNPETDNCAICNDEVDLHCMHMLIIEIPAYVHLSCIHDFIHKDE